MRKIKEHAGALKIFKILIFLALPVGIYLAFMGVNQNLFGGMEEKENLIHTHTDETFQMAGGENKIEPAKEDDKDHTYLAALGIIDTLAGMEAEQFAASEDFAEGAVESAEAAELPGREMPGHEKVALASRMTAVPEKTAIQESTGTENGISKAEQEKKAASQLKTNETPESTVNEAPESTVNKVSRPVDLTVNEAVVSEAPGRDSPTVENDPYLNQYVLDVIKTYKIGKGNYPYLLNNDYANYNGVTSTLSYKGKVLLKAHPSGSRASHCVGITFEVFFKAMQERNRQLELSADDFNGLSWDNLFDLALYWFVASGTKSTNNIVLGVEKYGIGKGIQRLEDAQPGDFIDFNRVNGTGHTVVFLNWIRDGDRIIGFRYWSSQGSTGGINYNEEYFNLPGKKGNVIMKPIYIVRILPVSQYKSSNNVRGIHIKP